MSLYGPAFVGHKNGYVAYNRLISCTTGVENDDATKNTGGNIFECNRVTAIGTAGSITGGVIGKKTNYSSNIVRYNVIIGPDTSITWSSIASRVEARNTSKIPALPDADSNDKSGMRQSASRLIETLILYANCNSSHASNIRMAHNSLCQLCVPA